MRMLLDTFGQTLRTLWVHKLRSFLTMFGIAWGVGSLLLLVGVGEGFRNGNRKQLETFGKNIIFFFGGRAPAVEGSFSAMKWFNLTYDDYLAIRNESKLAINISPVIARDDIRGASDYTSTNGQLKFIYPATNLTFALHITNDTVVELNETIFVNFSNPTNAVVGSPGVVTILDDDSPTTFT